MRLSTFCGLRRDQEHWLLLIHYPFFLVMVLLQLIVTDIFYVTESLLVLQEATSYLAEL
jgi:hypothetical protein